MNKKEEKDGKDRNREGRIETNEGVNEGCTKNNDDKYRK